MDITEFILEYMAKVYNLSRNYALPYSNFLTHIFKALQVSLESEELHHSQIPTINENRLKSPKFKPLPFGCSKHAEDIFTDDIETPTPQPYLEVIPHPWTKCFRGDVKEIKWELTSMKASQGEIQ